MEPNKMTLSDSVNTIQKSLESTKIIKTNASFYYLWWGSILLIYYFSNFLLLSSFKETGNTISQWLWLIFPLGAVGSIFNKKKDDITETAISKSEKTYFYTFTAFAMMFAVTSMYSLITNTLLSLKFLPMMLGTTVYVTGGITKHKPSIFGGVLSVSLTIFSLTADTSLNYLFAAIAVVLSCIIPGLLMKNSNV